MALMKFKKKTVSTPDEKKYHRGQTRIRVYGPPPPLFVRHAPIQIFFLASDENISAPTPIKSAPDEKYPGHAY